MSFWFISAQQDRRICEAQNVVRSEVNARTSEINAVINSQRQHLRSRIGSPNPDLVAEGLNATRSALLLLDGAQAENVQQRECPGVFG